MNFVYSRLASLLGEWLIGSLVREQNHKNSVRKNVCGDLCHCVVLQNLTWQIGRTGSLKEFETVVNSK